MSPEPRVWRHRVRESGTKYHRSRLVDRNGTVLAQADFTGTIVVKVYDLDSETPETAVYEASNTVASWVFNSLQTWEDDATGYNFEGSISSNSVSWEGGHTYRVCYYLRRTVASGSGTLVETFENKVDWQLGA